MVILEKVLDFVGLLKYQWFRKMLGGDWYLNRYWWDAGRSMACWWE